jgi:hypothetical protein
MTIVETIVPVIAALGVAGGGIYTASKAFPVILGALRGRSVPGADRESPVPPDRAAERSRCVTHAELAAAVGAALTQHRVEFGARIDAVEADCERRADEAERRSEERYEKLVDRIGGADQKVAHVVGILEGLRSGQPQSRRGRG